MLGCITEVEEYSGTEGSSDEDSDIAAAIPAPESDESDQEASESNYPVVVFETSMGNFEVELYEDKAPISVENFLSYVEDGFYDGLIFHRVIDGFMIQGGELSPSSLWFAFSGFCIFWVRWWRG